MQTNPGELVHKFFASAGILNKAYCQDTFSEDFVLEWHSSKGIVFLDYYDILSLSKDLRQSYFTLRAEVNETIVQENKVHIRYVYYVRTLENPDEELVLAVFMANFEVEDGKIVRGYQMSQLMN